MNIREAVAADWPSIVRCQAQLEERVGRPAGSMDLPELMILNDKKELVRNPAVFYWVVERDGEIVEAFYIELCLEWNLVGTDPEALKEITEFRETVFAMASKAGARWLHSFVMPGPWEAANGRHLDKAKLKPTGMIHYRRML
jgi:hypothetical protein